MFKLVLKGNKRSIANIKTQKLFIKLLSENKFFITKDGNITNIKTNKTYSRVGNHGYIEIAVKIKNKKYAILAHRLVWLYFRGWIGKHELINHKDGVKTNNALSNLELTDYAGNAQHAWNNGLYKVTARMYHRQTIGQRGERNSSAKLSNKQAEDIRNLYKTGKYTHRELGLMYEVHPTSIGAVINNKSFKKGFKLLLNNRKVKIKS